MKAKRATKIALTTLCCAAIMSFGNVFAAEGASGGETVYPNNFEQTLDMDSLGDYAIYGDTYAFISNNKITVLYTDGNGERKSRSFSPDVSGAITELDYDESGKLYFKTSSDYSYLYNVNLYDPKPNDPKLEPVQQSHEFQGTENTLLNVGQSVFYTLSNAGELEYWHSGEHTPVGAEGDKFSIIKTYGNDVYVIKDGNKPHKLDGATATPLDLTYTNFERVEIFSGDTATLLQDQSYQVKTGSIKRGTYYTKLKDDSIDAVFKTEWTQKAEANKPCIILCASGNASIVATNDGMFITATENITESAYYRPNNDWSAPYAYSVTDVGVYSSPYMCESTRVGTLKSGAENRAEVIEKFELDYIKTKFYRIRFTETTVDVETGIEETRTVTGFVAASNLTPYNFAAEDKEPHENGDKNFNYDTNVVSVVLTIIIVALVLVAVMYISLIGTKKNRTKREKKKSGNREPENPEDYNEDEDE